MIVDLPEPEGAEKIISFPAIVFFGYKFRYGCWWSSVHVEYLFLNLFQFVLHLHHDFLHLGMIGFAA